MTPPRSSDFHAGRKLGPGAYEHNGQLHIDAVEACLHFGKPPTEQNQALIAEGVLEAVKEASTTCSVEIHER